MDSVFAREEPTRRSTLSRDAIVRAAIAVADAEGLDAVSIRRVAAELGARAMSIYTYIARKEDLFDLMVDEVAGETVIDGPPPSDWREATIAIARLERASARRHPWLVTVVASRRTPAADLGPNMLRHVEESFAALDGLDAPLRLKWELMAAVSDYSTGFILREVRSTAGDDVTPLLRDKVAGGDYPHLAEILAEPSPAADTFEKGLRWLLEGFIHRG